MLPINKRAGVVTASLLGKGEPSPHPPALVAMEGEAAICAVLQGCSRKTGGLREAASLSDVYPVTAYSVTIMIHLMA